MSLKWTDVLDIGIELADKFPEVDPIHINFVDLRDKVMGLDDFDDEADAVVGGDKSCHTLSRVPICY